MIGPIAKRLHQNLTPFDPTNVVFHFDANAGNTLVINLLDRGERPVAGFLLRLLKHHPLWGKALKSRILPQRTAVGERQVLRIRNGLVMFLTFIGVTQVAHLAPTVMNHGVRVAAVQDRTLSASRLLYQLNPSGEKRLKPLICRFDFLYQLAQGLIGTPFEARNAKKS